MRNDPTSAHHQPSALRQQAERSIFHDGLFISHVKRGKQLAGWTDARRLERTIAGRQTSKPTDVEADGRGRTDGSGRWTDGERTADGGRMSSGRRTEREFRRFPFTSDPQNFRSDPASHRNLGILCVAALKFEQLSNAHHFKGV